ncbi:MAG: hypothetical protein COV01_02160 [Candidatus Taylorbacteria bacterium CG10_big_fil_rev_8_21_14_0_10_41_48]|uniref:Uncharacterized protein n=1 Tax=Candidatus Taylorbacteria bacterium CG10_big_fil_rev_8_21_14_0_10_41_48 TaxID=1975024 RepID=A0A2M8LCC3_9BACT|nr:MAG: hypothetical protein COV01_02160 [Candidatus Taylorbacteria bacterium CG10_big_fil_rev_8_21_14_0_10_41_48]
MAGLLLSVYIHLSEVGTEMGGIYTLMIFSMFIGAILMMRAPYSLKNIDMGWVSILRILISMPIVIFIYETTQAKTLKDDDTIGTIIFLSILVILIMGMKLIRRKYMKPTKIDY